MGRWATEEVESRIDHIAKSSERRRSAPLPRVFGVSLRAVLRGSLALTAEGRETRRPRIVPFRPCRKRGEVSRLPKRNPGKRHRFLSFSNFFSVQPSLPFASPIQRSPISLSYTHTHKDVSSYSPPSFRDCTSDSLSCLPHTNRLQAEHALLSVSSSLSFDMGSGREAS